MKNLMFVIVSALLSPVLSLGTSALAQTQLQQVQSVPTAATPASTPAPTQPIVGINATPPPAPTPIPVQQVEPQPTASELPPGFPSINSQQENRGPREEMVIPSEVISVLPPAAKASEIRAVLRTSMGDITVKLDRVNAPMTVAHFVALSRGDKDFIDVKTSKPVKRSFYNGLTFHRVVKGTLIQTGCPFGNGRGGPGSIATIADEVKPNMKFNRAGLVAMAPLRENGGKSTVKNTNGSQFFISLKEMPDWNNQYTIFGEVEDGMDVVQKIANVKVGPTERPIKRVYLVAIEIIEQ